MASYEDDEEQGGYEGEEGIEGVEGEAGYAEEAAEGVDAIEGDQEQYQEEGDQDQDQEAADEDADADVTLAPSMDRAVTDPTTSSEFNSLEQQRHPPITIQDINEQWIPYHAVIDTGCEDDWISLQCVQKLGLETEIEEITPEDDEFGKEFVAFNGQSMVPTGKVYIYWEAQSTGRTVETDALIAENGPFDFLIGANFYMGMDGPSYFAEPDLIMKTKKPSQGTVVSPPPPMCVSPFKVTFG